MHACSARELTFRHLDATFPKYFMRMHGADAPFEVFLGRAPRARRRPVAIVDDARVARAAPPGDALRAAQRNLDAGGRVVPRVAGPVVAVVSAGG